MDLSGTLLFPLHPLQKLIEFLRMLFADDAGTDETGDTKKDDQTSEEGDTGDGNQGDDGDSEGEDDDDESSEEDSLDDDLPDDEKTRRNANRMDSLKDEQLTTTMEAFVDLLVDNPAKAEEKLQKLREEDPIVAARLARMFKNRKNNALGDMLDGADDVVREAFKNLSEQVSKLSEKTQAQIDAEDKRVYLAWEKESHPYLNPKSPEGKTKIGQNLRASFYEALDRVTSDDAPIDDQMLEDALAIAKRRVGWNDKKVKRAIDKFAAEQAAKGRTVTTPKGGTGLKGKESPSADPKVAEMFGNVGPERLKKIAEAKAAAGF